MLIIIYLFVLTKKEISKYFLIFYHPFTIQISNHHISTINKNNKYFYKFDGDGLRYEINNFLECINNKVSSIYWNKKEILSVVSVIDKFRNNKNIFEI